MRDTKPLAPLHIRQRDARLRLTATFGEYVGPPTAAGYFDSCVQELRQLGLEGPGLIVAAEHMAIIRLRELATRDAAVG
jgi:hypothetical protein